MVHMLSIRVLHVFARAARLSALHLQQCNETSACWLIYPGEDIRFDFIIKGLRFQSRERPWAR